MASMTKQVILDSCKKNGGYQQPHLNDQLFLHCKGFGKIESLEAYVNVKVLWLEQNAISEITGVSHMSKLVSLFLQQNLLRTVNGLAGLSNLRILNISQNYLTRIDGLADCCPLLESLQASHNRFESLADLADVRRLQQLSSIDVSNNHIGRSDGDDDQCIVSFFSAMPAVSVVYLQGNEISRVTKNYRKNMILGLPALTYLDDRPVFPEERRAVTAWGQGGAEAEKAERQRIQQEHADRLTECVRQTVALQESKKGLREAAEKRWNEQQEQRRQREKDVELETVRRCVEADHEEFEARATALDGPEADEWRSLENAALADRQDAWRRGVAAAERNEARRVADAELEAERRRVDAEMAERRALKARDEEEMRYWIDQFEREDAAVERGMQDELNAFLAELVPGAAPPAEAREATRRLSADPKYSPAKQRPGAAARAAAPPVVVAAAPPAGAEASAEAEAVAPAARHADPNAEVPPVAAAVAPAAPVKSAKKKFFGTECWEKYYAWEQAAVRPKK